MALEHRPELRLSTGRTRTVHEDRNYEIVKALRKLGIYLCRAPSVIGSLFFLLFLGHVQISKLRDRRRINGVLRHDVNRRGKYAVKMLAASGAGKPDETCSF
ncbi:hypothetical protein PQR02_37480 [Paraburkholderia sediminicola]|uniref:Uncharacterized protein n=1 Tax=Paraburkholderia rhynchosiae TaxID=487049 RepID=A0ACC7NNP7_9BURK